MADGIEARARRLKQLKRDLGLPLVKARPVRVELLSAVLEPLGPVFAVEGEDPYPKGLLCFNLTVIPNGLYFPPDGMAPTKWHVTGEMIDGVPELRQVLNLVTAEVGAAAMVTTKPSRVEPGPERTEPVATGVVKEEAPAEGSGQVTAAELAMARAEAKAIRKAEKGGRGVKHDPNDLTTDLEMKIWGGIASRRVNGGRVDTSWLWGGDGSVRVVKSQPTPYWPV